MCDAVAEIDLIISFVNFSKNRICCFPRFTDKFVVANTYNLVVPDVKQTVTIFSCNSLNKHVITGPNMGGKTTYLKTIAVISILSQIGSPICAESAEIRIYDQMFTKLAQNDNFEKEWLLATSILKKSTDHTLILLDEMGRSTEYSSGLSFSVAFVLALCRGTLFFSTHFLDMMKYLKDAKNVNFVGVNDFKARSGVCGYFRGIELARKYFPRKVIEYAEKVCKKWRIKDCNKIRMQVALKIVEGKCDERCINKQDSRKNGKTNILSLDKDER
ncbi:Mismatch repair ATPase MSH4 (MutS family) [Trachipleistophora hominis]|uniref:Mismatch repair ATPase MSH4 (MutS family) n=1 Tax=Trachipleistophora hominis TaxID=72359 RepID=L7JYD7_TRAHO|nr:Mismatch repair ATPase MSH4 (MutS family) [Trachipleistophora hominis]